MDFRSYDPPQGQRPDQKAQTNETEQQNKTHQQDANNQQLNETVKLAKLLTTAFQGKSQGDIWRSILQQAERGKKDGTLTNDDLDTFFATVSPLLDGFKKRKLQQMIEQLKQIE